MKTIPVASAITKEPIMSRRRGSTKKERAERSVQNNKYENDGAFQAHFSGTKLANRHKIKIK